MISLLYLWLQLQNILEVPFLIDIFAFSISLLVLRLIGQILSSSLNSDSGSLMLVIFICT